MTLDRAYQAPESSGRTYTIAGKLPHDARPCNVIIPPPYCVGKISVHHGSAVVTGNETAWRKELEGWHFQILGESPEYGYIVSQVNSVTHITLNKPYEGPGRKDIAYALNHPYGADFGLSENWDKRIHIVNYHENVTETIRTGQDAQGRQLTGKKASVAGSIVTLSNCEADLSGITVDPESPFSAYLRLGNDANPPNKRYRILALDNQAKTVTVEGTPNITGNDVPWAIGLPVRKYEVFLLLPPGELETSQTNPIVYANVGVSAADDREHSKDHPKWTPPWNDRHGNEGRVGGPRTVVRVHRTPPEAPTPPPDSPKVYASLPDYHGHAFYTYRWPKPQNDAPLKAHIFRALDSTLFKRDWLIRTTRSAFDPAIPRHAKLFPDSEEWDSKKWPLERRQKAASQLNAIKSKADYAALSTDAREVLGLLPGNEGRKWNNGLQDHDWIIRTTRKNLTANDKKYYPEDWCKPDNLNNELRRGNVAQELNKMVVLLTGTAAKITGNVIMLDGAPDLTRVKPYRDTIWLESDEARADKLYQITAVDNSTHTVTLDDAPKLSGFTSVWALYLDDHRSLSNDGMRMLAGLPGNERAFTLGDRSDRFSP